MNLKSVVVLIVTALLAQQANAASTIEARSVARPEGERHYLLMQPQDAASDGLRPLLILLHGRGASAEFALGRVALMGFTSPGWRNLAEREKLLVMAPDGSKASDGMRAWNDCRSDATANTTSDDVGLIAALIETAIREHRADPRRIYVFGFSNGGGLAYRLGIELGPRLAAVAVQGALMPAQSSCKPATHPLPIYISHGTQDKVMPYAGGALGGGRGSGVSAEESVAIWRRLDGLPEKPIVDRFPQLTPSSTTSVTRFVWGDDPRGLQVCFLRIEGGGHVHASRTEEFSAELTKFMGEMNHDVDTVEEVWAFFREKRALAN